jgi:uncharacterized protein (UPF0548 family)
VSVLALPPPECERLRTLPLTYAEVGRAGGVLPDGYHHTRASRLVSSRAEDLDVLGALLLGWRVHQRAGLVVASSDREVVPGAVVLLTLRLGLLRVNAPCRVLRVVNEPHRRGFAYGTLPGHPESGEEEFMLHTQDAAGVTATVRAFSKPVGLLPRTVGPVGRRLQSVMTTRYLDAMTMRDA